MSGSVKIAWHDICTEEHNQQNWKCQGPRIDTIKQKRKFQILKKRKYDNVVEDITNMHIECKTQQNRMDEGRWMQITVIRHRYKKLNAKEKKQN
jgi:hypothetical protein